MIKAAIFMGDPRYIYGLSYDVGTCTAHGVSTSSRYWYLSMPIFVPWSLNICSLPSFWCLFSSILENIADANTQFAPRPAGFSCPSASKIKSYCDASDPYCCNGSNAATHQGYGAEYGQQALAFVNSKLS
jgi:acetylxylan esterase